MPENAYRRGHLYSHLAASTKQTYPVARVRRLHPDWRDCAAGCGWPVDPAADTREQPTHPACDKESE